MSCLFFRSVFESLEEVRCCFVYFTNCLVVQVGLFLDTLKI